MRSSPSIPIISISLFHCPYQPIKPIPFPFFTAVKQYITMIPNPHFDIFLIFIILLRSLLSLSMKLAKSILSPVRATRDFSFLSRRLRLRRNKASFFGKKAAGGRGGGFETHEPSSPKVTCIGQVRVKSKRKVRQCRSLSKRRSSAGEVSFRKAEQSEAGGGEYDRACSRRHQQPPPECLPHRNQRWVHLPVSSVCEALRELCCLFPCRSCCFSCSCSCCSRKVGCCPNDHRRGCGAAAFCRWMVCMGDGGGGGKREIEVEDEERSCRRNHVFENIEVRDGRIEVKGRQAQGVGEETAAARVSICIPPKNALLLMRCRSDPMKMAALANRITWAAAPPNYEDEDNVEQGYYCGDYFEEQDKDDDTLVVKGDREIDQHGGAEACIEMQEEREEILVEGKGQESGALLGQEEVESNMSSFEALLDHDNNTDHYQSSSAESNDEAHQMPAEETSDKGTTTTTAAAAITANNDKPNQEEEEEEEPNQEDDDMDGEIDQQVKNPEINEGPVLPECLLLMMCEPKLSMEVSKETWVRGTDFIRWLPARKPARVAKAGCCHHHHEVKRKPAPPGIGIAESKPAKPAGLPKRPDPQQAARSSCSLPAANAEEANGGGGVYEPLILTRCKSEPMRTAAAKLMPEPCSRKDMGLKVVDPHRLGSVI